MGVRQLLSEVSNRVEGNSFEVWEEANGSVQAYQNGNPLVAAKVDPVSGKTKSIIAAAVTLSSFATAALNPYKLATFGDSRANSGSHRNTTGASGGVSGEKVPGCLTTLRGDINIVFNGGVSGDTVANWNSAGRVTSGQTVKDLLLTQPDLCYIQYGINDLIAGTAAATIVGNLQLLIDKIIGAGVPVIFESINTAAIGAASYIAPYSVTGGFGASAAAKLAALLDVNSQMKAWLAQFPGNIALYVDTSSVTSSADGYAKTDQTYSDGTHVSSIGAMRCAALLNIAMQDYWPVRRGQRIKPQYPNSLSRSMLNPSAGRAANFSVILNEYGTATATYSIVTDADGDLCQQYDVTVTALSSGYAIHRFDMLSDFHVTSPFYTLVAGDSIQGAIDYMIDNGSGGAPIAYQCFVRARMYYDATYNARTSVYTSSGNTVAASGSSDHKALLAAETGKLLTGKIVLDAPTANLTMLSALQFYVATNVLGTYRLRIKNPQLCLINAGLRAATVAASPYLYINNTETSQQVIVAGGTISALAINGVATGLTSGVFLLSPGDTLTLTYTVAPTGFMIKQI